MTERRAGERRPTTKSKSRSPKDRSPKDRSPKANDPMERAASRAARRESYIDAAIAVISDEGPTASMEAIASAAGVSKPILYRHFGDREGLVAALGDRFTDALVERLDAVLTGRGTPEEVIRLAIDAYVATIEADPSLYRFLTQRSPARGAVLSSLVDRVAAVIAQTIAESLRLAGLDTGPARPWSYGIVGMVHLAGDDWVAHPGIPRARLVEELTRLLWQGLGAVFPDYAVDLPVTRTGREEP